MGRLTPLAVGRVGAVYPLISSTHFLSCVLAVFFFQRVGTASPALIRAPLRHRDPQDPHPPTGHTLGPPTRPEPTRHPLPHSNGCCWAEGLLSPHPTAVPTLCDTRVGFGDGWVGGRPATWVPSRLPKGAGPRGARGRALRSPSWLTHSPHCGCEVPRECSSSREHPEVGAALPRTPPPPPQPPSTPNPPACSGEGTAWGPSVPRSGCGLAPCPRAGCGPTARWGWQVPWGRRCGVRVTRSHCSRCSVLGARLPVRHGERIPPRPPPSISPTPRGRRGRNGARLRALT